LRRFLTPVAAVVAVFLLAALPDVLTIEDDRVVLHLSMFATDTAGYFRGLFGGASFLYRPFSTSVPYRSILSEMVRPFFTSFAYAGFSAVAAMLIGSIGGMLLVAYRKEQVKDVVSLFGIIPDFIMILLLQLIVVATYKATGFHVARVATITQGEPALLLPLLILSLIPAVFILRSISNRTYIVTTEEFVLVARAQGFSRFAVYRRHILPHVLAALRSDLHKITALVLGNLFITEYLFNIPGITRLVFSYGRGGGYQFNLLVNAFLAILLLYGLLFSLLQLMIRLVEMGGHRG
jgi:peptide/nickel transport system permease protein